MNSLNYLMACTVSAQTLKTRCCCVRPLLGSEPFCNFRLCSPPPKTLSLPFAPYLCPLPPLPWDSQHSHSPPCGYITGLSSTALRDDDDDVTLMPVSRVLIQFVCCPSWLAVLLCEVLPLINSMFKKGLDETEGMMGKSRLES